MSRKAAERFMQALRNDHAGLSRVLREIDLQQACLQSDPETARRVLAEAMRYLLLYQHSVHHPREDRLFTRIRGREPGLYRNMSRLVREHRTGQRQAELLARELARATAAQLRGLRGHTLARQLQQYVRHTREHMKREEAVFYSGAERVLRPSDWSALASGTEQRDPAGDLQRLAARYPRLAARLAQPERVVIDAASGESPHRDALRQQAERVIEIYARLAHGALDLVRSVTQPLRR
jgi:hemerythrin-like domain-containing protein